MYLKFETIIHILRKIIQLIVVIILKSPNKYYRKNISKSGRKMDLYPAMSMFIYNMADKYGSNWIDFTLKMILHLKGIDSLCTNCVLNLKL